MFRRSQRHRLEGYLSRLYGYAFSLTCDADQAQDLVHDAAVKALSARKVPRDEAAYRAWLFTILRNAFVDRSRKRTRRNTQLAELQFENDETWTRWSETQEVNALTVRFAFGKLPVNHREILAAIDVAGLSYNEAAQLFSVPVGTVMSRISRARSALYRLVEETTAEGSLTFLPVRQRKSSGR